MTDDADSWAQAMVVFHDEPRSEPGADRAARHEATRSATSARRDELVDRLTKAGLEREVELAGATALPSLLVKGSCRALDELRRAPTVRDIYELSDAPIEPL